MKNIVILTGASGIIEWHEWFKNECEKLGYNVVLPVMPCKHDKNPNYPWVREELFKLMEDGTINKDSIVVAHSLGTLSFAKFVAETGLSVYAFISVAGFCGKLRYSKNPKLLVKNRVKQVFTNKLEYHLSEEEAKKAAPLLGIKHAMYSDNDHLISKKELERYANLIGAEHHFFEGRGHFSRTSKTMVLPEIMDILKKLG